MLSESAQAAPAWLPPLNTGLIVISGVFLLMGYYFIRRRQIDRHRLCMLTAAGFAAAFLVVYVTRALLFETKVFAGEGWVRIVYLAILGTHTILATIVGPMALLTLYRALKRKFPQHRAIARITLPVWLYVVLSGWIVYLMLYQLG